MAIFAGLPANSALAYSPISLPALKLLVAKRALLAFWGSSAVSSAMKTTPWDWYFLIVGTIAFVSLGAMRVLCTRWLTVVTMAVTGDVSAPSNFPAAVTS